jgi:tetratricopeptide (TPR) repeat protein
VRCPRDKRQGRADPARVTTVPLASRAELDARRALAVGDPLLALGLIGRVDSAVGRLLRGVAYAQLGDLDLAREALERAVIDADEPQTRARARAALVEIALNTGDPAPAARAAEASARELAALGDARNAAMQRLVLARAEVLLGRLDEAREVVETVAATELPPDLRALACLTQAEIAVRALGPTAARGALLRARRCLEEAPHPLLERALAALGRELSRPVARIQRAGVVAAADLFAIEAVSGGSSLLVDACRHLAIGAAYRTAGGRVTVPLARRPVLFALLLILARAWPSAVGRDELASQAFEARQVNASHRARLRVEIGRLRKVMGGLSACPFAAEGGYVLRSEREVVVLLPPSDDDVARLGFLLADGASWSAQGLAEHAGISRRTAQRALAALVESGAVIRTGSGTRVRYARPGGAIASRMLLLGLVPQR